MTQSRRSFFGWLAGAVVGAVGVVAGRPGKTTPLPADAEYDRQLAKGIAALDRGVLSAREFQDVSDYNGRLAAREMRSKARPLGKRFGVCRTCAVSDRCKGFDHRDGAPVLVAEPAGSVFRGCYVQFYHGTQWSESDMEKLRERAKIRDPNIRPVTIAEDTEWLAVRGPGGYRPPLFDGGPMRYSATVVNPDGTATQSEGVIPAGKLKPGAVIKVKAKGKRA